MTCEKYLAAVFTSDCHRSQILSFQAASALLRHCTSCHIVPSASFFDSVSPLAALKPCIQIFIPQVQLQIGFKCSNSSCVKCWPVKTQLLLPM